MLRALGREREAGEREEAVPQQLLVRPLTEKRTRNSLGFSFPFFFFCFLPLLDSGCRVKARSFLSLSPFQRAAVTTPTSTAAAVLGGSQKPPLLSAALLCEHAQREWFRVLPVHLQKKPTAPAPGRGVQRFAGAGGGVDVCVWVATGARRHGPGHWPLRMTLVSLSSRVLVSTVTLRVSLNTQSARPAAAAVIG